MPFSFGDWGLGTGGWGLGAGDWGLGKTLSQFLIIDSGFGTEYGENFFPVPNP
ncbi:hypothetical protein [Nostoc sp. UHCC 0302]|uniref:hypothetical protein n=1 Tax=Nostoc sp. UHCC 0302 TaxID=3134896 RepID=UPI00311CCB6A